MVRLWVTLVVALLVAGALAGCSQSAAPPGDPAAPVVVDATGKAQVEEAPAKETVATPAGKVAVNKGLIIGQVHDAANFSVAGASVALLGTERATTTSWQGEFRFENATPGAFDLRVEAAGFAAKEQRVEVKAGQEARVDITLLPRAGVDVGMAPHIHDYWGSATQWTLMDEVVAMPEQRPELKGTTALLRPNNGANWPFVIPEQEQNRPATIWPGTKEIRFTLSWPTEPENDLPNAGIELQSPLMDDPMTLGYVPNGGTLTYVLDSANETDLGHQGWTSWLFWLDVDNSLAGDPTGWEPALGWEGVHVKMEILKGNLTLELAHRDFWMDTEMLPIGDQVRGCHPNTGVPPSEADQTTGPWICPIHQSKEDGAVNIIPPGTKKIQVAFGWTHANGPLPFTYSLTYRTAGMDPVATTAAQFRTPTVVARTASSVLYEIELEPGDADGFYQARSAWVFKWWWDDNPGYQTGYPVKFQLAVTAFKDPAYA